MGRFSDKIKAAAQEALINGTAEEGEIESLVEIIAYLKDLSDDGKLKTLLDAKVTASDVSTAISNAITTALAENGSIATAIASAVTAGITAAIGEGGAIETWADNRYAAKG